MSRRSEIERKLAEAFAPSALDVRDDSERHIGHAGYQEGGESHFHVVMRAEAFRGVSRVNRHRAVHSALGAELVSKIHALSLDLDA